jgi:spore coat protein U-like protein
MPRLPLSGYGFIMPLDRRKQRSGAGYAGLVAAALTLALVVPPHAGGTAVLTVSATVNANCTMSASPVSFGRYESLLTHATAPLNAAGAVSIACTKGSAPKITMDLGRTPNGGRRHMALAAAGAPGAAETLLYYELYQPPSSAPGTGCSFPGTMAWGPSGAQTFAPGPSAARGSRTYSVCGTIPAGQDVSMGSYADTVVATVNF